MKDIRHYIMQKPLTSKQAKFAIEIMEALNAKAEAERKAK